MIFFPIFAASCGWLMPPYGNAFAQTQALFLDPAQIILVAVRLYLCKIPRMDIKATRKALGLTQAQLAEKLGVDHSTISRFESGDIVPNDRTLLAMEALVNRAQRDQAA